MPNYVDQLDFVYRYYQENILLVGMVGSGKTQFARKNILYNGNIKRWIWDESDQFEGLGLMTKDLSELTDSNHVLQLNEKTQGTFDQYTKILYENAKNWDISNLVNVIDEVQKYVQPQDKTSDLYKIVTSMRNKGISNIFMTPSPSLIPPYIRENTIHIFGFHTTDYNHIKYMEQNFFGESAWLMTTKDKRDKLKDEPNLPKYSVIYRNIYEDETQIWINPNSL